MYQPLFNKREVIVFRQFKRKGWALFACLGREVVISVLSVATLSATEAATVSDGVWHTDTTQATAREVWLDDVGVTGSRAPLAQSQAARMVTVLTRDDIQAAPVQSVNDLLKLAVGVDVRQRGALGSQTDISIRGGTQEQVIILLNGINICDPQTGHNTLDLPVQLSEIVRVEVLEGPAGRAYGTSSLVGAINIVTRPAAQSGADALVEGGSHGYARAGGRVTMAGGAWANQLSAGYTRSDGFSHAADGHRNTDYSGSKAFYQGSYEDEQVRVSWHLGLADKGWGSGTFYGTGSDNQYEHTTKLYSALQAETRQGALRLRPTLYWNQHRDRYEWHRGQRAPVPYNYNRCNVYGIALNSHFDWMLGRTAFGGELRNEELLSANLGEPLDQPHHIHGTERDYTLGANRTNLSAHVEHNVLLQRLTLSAGFVAAQTSWNSTGLRLYPGVDASYQLTQQLRLFAGWNSSLRLPSFTEMYYRLRTATTVFDANPHLKAEEMQAVEVGAHYTSPAIEAKVSLYHHHGRNMIDWIQDTRQGADAPWQSVNHTRLNTNGMEASLRLELQQLLPSQHVMQRLSLSYGYAHQDKDLEEGVVSQYALEYLRHKLVGSIQLNPWRRLELRLGARWQHRMGTYTDRTGQARTYRPYCLADARVQWAAPRYTLYAEATNLLNHRSYTDYGNVPQPGRWLVAGVTVSLYSPKKR